MLLASLHIRVFGSTRCWEKSDSTLSLAVCSVSAYFFRSCGELEVVKLAWWRNLDVNEVIPASAGIVPSSYRQEYCVMPSSFPLSAMINSAGNKPMLWRKSGQCFPMSAYSRGDQPHSKVQPLCFALIYVLCLAMGYEKFLEKFLFFALAAVQFVISLNYFIV